jgi:tetrahydromethanopterin S-methyltransferase subunit C
MTLLYGALSAVVFGAPHIRPAVRYGLGGTVAGIGAAYDVGMLPTVFASDSHTVIHDFGHAATVPDSVPLVIE